MTAQPLRVPNAFEQPARQLHAVAMARTILDGHSSRVVADLHARAHGGTAHHDGSQETELPGLHRAITYLTAKQPYLGYDLALAPGRPIATRSRRSWLPPALALLVCAWGGNQFTPLLSMYRERAHYSQVEVNLFLAVYVVGLVPALLTGAALSGRFGRRKVVVAATALSAVSSAVLACGPLTPWALYTGRLLTGAALGLAMTVGTLLVRELSRPPYDLTSAPGAGARRVTVLMTAGFGGGAGLAGVLAQWGPWPQVLPYLIHVAVCLPVLFALHNVPRTEGERSAAPRPRLTVPLRSYPRFTRVVLPAAPWVFASGAIAYAVVPAALASRTGSLGSAYATLLTVLTLATGILIQPVARRMDSARSARSTLTGLAVIAAGTLLAAWSAHALSLLGGCVAGVVLGAGYGITVVSGLLEVQRIAAPEHQAAMSGVYYAFAYSGFVLPVVLASLTGLAGYAVLLCAVALALLLCLVAVACRSGRGLPPAQTPTPVRHDELQQVG